MDFLLNFYGEITLVFTSYLLGCICAGYYLVKIYLKKDIRTLGSGNLGARNVGRVLGPVGFVLTLLGDAGKCYAVVFVASFSDYGHHIQIAVIVMTITGHIWPVQLEFRGGKGFATMVGGFLAYDLVLFILLISLACVIALFVRRLTLSVLGAVTLSPFVALAYSEPFSVVIGFLVIAVLIIYAHRDNIRSELA